jgi:O-antigen ligase
VIRFATLATRLGTVSRIAVTHVLIPAGTCGLVAILLVRREVALASVVALLPFAALLVEKYLASNGVTLVVVAMVMNLSGLPFIGSPLATHPVNIYIPDVLVALACLHRAVGTFGRRQTPGRLTPSMRAALSLFLLALTVGVFEGHAAYDTQFVSNATRLGLYSLFMLSTGTLTPAQLERGLRIGFYAGVVISALLGTYYLATGISQTTQSSLSTGGVRLIGLSAAMYAAGGMVMAMLSIVRTPPGASTKIHWSVLVLGLYLQVLSLGRATFIALAIVLPLIMLGSRAGRRRGVLVVLLLLTLGAGITLFNTPPLPPQVATFERRIFNSTAQDPDIQWRAKAAAAELSGIGGHLFSGFGFGRVAYFTLDNTFVPVLGGDPHDGFLYLLAGGGVLALGSFILVLAAAGGALFRRALRAPPDDMTVLLWAAGFLLIYVLNFATEPVLSQAQFMPTLWILLGIPFAATRRAS